jgi:REP element-mobilizing transposase RayT
MAIEQGHLKYRGIYFCTITCYKWLPLIERTNAYDHIYNTFNLWREQKVFITGYVIMPNHVHFLVYIQDEDINLAKIVSNFKRFLAYDIVKRLTAAEEYGLLAILRSGVKNDARNKIHEVFQPSFDAKECYADRFLLQKLDYMHANPVNGKWKLAEDYRDYEHSSAGFYEKGIASPIEILDYREI